jgi:hypothetical protein
MRSFIIFFLQQITCYTDDLREETHKEFYFQYPDLDGTWKK